MFYPMPFMYANESNGNKKDGTHFFISYLINDFTG